MNLRAWALAIPVVACGGNDDEDSGWVEVASASELPAVYDLWAFASDDVRLAGSQGMIERFDGDAWTSEPTPTTAPILGLWAFGPDDLWACGGTSILHYDGTAWAIVADVTDSGFNELTSIWASSPTDVWVVGDASTVVRWDGAAATATSIPSSSNSHIFGTSSDDVWIQGTFDLIHFDGVQWSSVETGLFGGEGEVWGTGPDDLWVVTDDEAAAHWDGTAFTVFESGRFIGGMAALWGAAHDDIWAAGSFGAIAHWEGEQWTEVEHQPIGSPQLRQFTAVHGSDAKNVWAVGQVLDEAGAHAIVHRLDR